jgi:hypothetical protein
MTDTKRLSILEKAIADGNGILPIEPAWVARDFLPTLYRLGLDEKEANVGKRGAICERWLASTTKADNAVGPPDEGLSYIALGGGERMTLKEAVEIGGARIMGKQYASAHPKGLGRLAKIYDFAARIPHHLHQMQKDAAKVGHNAKEEAYYFPTDVDLGPHPETFFGVHRWIVEQKKQEEVILPYLVDWNSDLILKHAWAELLVPGEGFHVPAGILHAPGTAVTIELQEDSDVFAMCQALVAGKIIPKDLLFKDVTPQDRKKYGERIILDQVDWELSSDPYFYENRHLAPVLANEQPGGREEWIYYNTKKFSGKRLVVKPGTSFTTKEKGVYSVLVWRGAGTYAGIPVKGQEPGRDEILVTHEKAVTSLEVKNTGKRDLEIIKFFGPDINPDCPMKKPYGKK